MADWIERQDRKVAQRPVRYWLIMGGCIAAWIAFLHAAFDRPIRWTDALIWIVFFPTLSVGGALFRERGRRPIGHDAG